MKMPGLHSVDARETLRDAAHFFGGIRWLYMGIAFFLAVFLWYVVTVRDKVDSWVDVRVEFKGAPSDLIIRDGLVNKVSVRLRGAAGLTRSLNSRGLSVALDLSRLVKGTNVLQVTPGMLPLPKAFEVLEITPQRIQILADSVGVRLVSLESAFDGALGGDFFVKSLKLNPISVSLRGPETLLNGIRLIRIPVQLGGITRFGISTLQAVVPVPENVTATPPQVTVDVEVGVRTKAVRLTRDVTVTLPGNRTARITPARVTVTVEIPESQAGNADLLARVIATLTVPPDMAHSGTHKLPVDVLLPETVVLKDISPKEVSLTFGP